MDNGVNESTDTATQEEVGTTERLFGKEAVPAEPEGAEAQPEEVEAEEQEVPPVEARQRDEKGRFTSEAKTEVPEYLNLEDFGDRKVKLKINGVEQDKTFADVVRGYQTDAALTQKGQRIAEEYNRLKTLKPEQAQPQATAPQAANTDDEFVREYIDPSLRPYKEKISALENTINGFNEVLAPVIYEANVKAIDNRLKSEGFTDFMQYQPKIVEKLMSLPIEEQMAYDTQQGYIAIYKDLKIQDLQRQMSAPLKEERKNPDARPKAKVVPIEGGGGSPTGADDSNSTLNAAMQKARESGRTQDFAEVIRLKYGG